MRLLLLIVMLATLSFPATCLSEEMKPPGKGSVDFKIHGPGYTAYGYDISCVQMVEGITDEDYRFLYSYVSGYLSSSNHLKSRKSAKDIGSYVRWILQYCIENRMDNLVIAAQQLDKELDEELFSK